MSEKAKGKPRPSRKLEVKKLRGEKGDHSQGNGYPRVNITRSKVSVSGGDGRKNVRHSAKGSAS